MAKFSGSVVQPGQVSEAQQEVIATAPVKQLEERTPQATDMSFEEFLASEPELPPGEVTPEAIEAGVEAGIAAEEQVASERIPTLRERGADTTTVHKWDPKMANSVPRADGGLKARALGMSEVFGGPEAINTLSITPTPEARPAALAGESAAVAQITAGTLTAALNRSGAVTTTQDPATRSFTNAIDPLMLQVGSAVTENMLAGATFGDTAEGVQEIDPSAQTPTISKAQNNAQLGQDIHREYSRMRNQAEGRPTDEYTDLPKAEATVLGDAFKEMWAITNPTLIAQNRVGDQVFYQLTPEGVEAMKKGTVDRKRLFPRTNVRPSKSPPPKGQLPGEVGRTVTKRKTGKVKQPLAGAKTIVQATENLSSVPNVVDRQREKILYLTILPVLSGEMDYTTWQAEVNNIGASKMDKFIAAQRAAARAGDLSYDAQAELADLQNTVAQEVRAIAQERDGANHLTYTVQSFTGRISPQQTYFDPTSSKAVRFVTRNAVPAPAAPGSRVEKNLRQMYAMMLVKGADALLPEGREEALNREAARLEKWGTRLAELVDGRMPDALLDEVATAIQQGVPLTDPNFPKIDPLTLDPTQDADLISAIRGKGEDGPHFIDGLIDFAKYNKAKREGRTHHSYFNAYVDGKTNGIAGAGVQMGSEQVARATGVLRNNTTQLLDEGDIRDQLRDNLIERLDRDGFDGDLGEGAQYLYELARAVYSFRDLNKATTMTFGYGKELDSFKSDIADAIDLLYAQAQQSTGTGPEVDTLDLSIDILDDKEAGYPGREAVVEILHKFYVGSLADVLSEDALTARGVMRSAALLHAITDQLFSIESATGFQLNIGGEATMGFNPETATRYQIKTPDGVRHATAGQYETYSTAAAPKREVGPTGEVELRPGGLAYGGSVTAPVQSLDAATVAMSVTGKSWDKLKAASNGNPYVHTIYDAFKFDAMGFDVGVQEVNKNWLDAGMNWSYLEATFDATKEKMEAWHKAMDQLPQGQLVDPTAATMATWLLSMGETAQGKPAPAKNLVRQFMSVLELPYEEAVTAAQRVTRAVNNAGVDTRGQVDNMTVRQMRVFVSAMIKELEVSKRLTSLINKTNANKKQLKKKIDAQKVHKANEVLQYYAH